MQQTPNYKLDLIEKTDDFSPDPLNANAQKLEDALNANDAARAALDGRVVKLENCRIVVGRYIGANKEMTFDLGERPAAVLVSYYGITSGYIALAVGGMTCIGNSRIALKLVDNGFVVNDILTFEPMSKIGFSYVAFLGGWEKNDPVTQD